MATPQFALELDDGATRLYFLPGEAITGRVRLVDSGPVCVQLVGIQMTRLERLGPVPSPPLVGKHVFLRLESWVLRDDTSAAAEEAVPFVFVLPSALLPSACTHDVDDAALAAEHLQLPPSLGGLASRDMAPTMAQVAYFVHAVRPEAHRSERELEQLLCPPVRIAVVPSRVEPSPPLLETHASSDYQLHAACVWKRHRFLPGRAGHVVLSGAPLPSIALQRPRFDDNSKGGTFGKPERAVQGSSAPTLLRLVVRFTAVAGAQATLPQLESLSLKLRACTFWAPKARGTLPSQAECALSGMLGGHVETVTLPGRALADVPWRRSPDHQDDGAYEAHVVAPVVLAGPTVFVPSFHACLVSRTYVLVCRIKLGAPGRPSLRVGLRLPLHMHVEGPGPPAYHMVGDSSEYQ